VFDHELELRRDVVKHAQEGQLHPTARTPHQPPRR
jgi:hypothetical protein